ncbi:MULTISPECIES: hypothetical protein [Myroides]|uniref:Uncharacterized protein n=1 Tax=Myroides albus TaxID=2562892 RepID=A0A6I3LKC4_9FLAO|nr:MULTISPECIES: hypothetical protein [Myroides]MTG98763.1 hypothetical protein [Myroides albus]MVX35892.1 hypothetical protein [Myroides sp. LoEW2-1]UVD79920.1 hypothetical protein NWE55_01110 [Myroides albus]
MRNRIITLIFLCLSQWMSAQSFSEKIGTLMQLVTENEVDTLAVKELVKTMVPNGKEFKENPMNYSMYDRLEGDMLYYTSYKTADEDRMSIEKLKMNDKPYYSIRFLVSSSYTIEKDGSIKYDQPDYEYNSDYESVKKYCTRAMSYKNGKGNAEDAPLLSCIYTNPESKRSLMYWVVFDNAVNDKKGNRIKEFKIQDVELWR